MRVGANAVAYNQETAAIDCISGSHSGYLMLLTNRVTYLPLPGSGQHADGYGILRRLIRGSSFTNPFPCYASARFHLLCFIIIQHFFVSLKSLCRRCDRATIYSWRCGHSAFPRLIPVACAIAPREWPTTKAALSFAQDLSVGWRAVRGSTHWANRQTGRMNNSAPGVSAPTVRRVRMSRILIM